MRLLIAFVLPITVSVVSAFTAQSPPLPTPATKPFGINAAFHVEPTRREEFLAVLVTKATSSLEDESAMQFVVGQDVDDSNKLYLHQEYGSRTDNPNVKTTYFDGAVAFLETQAFCTFPIANEFDLHHDGHDQTATNVKGAVCLNVELCIKPKVREEFLDVIRQNKAGSDVEPLCMQYSWGEDIYDPNKFHFHEQYVSEDGLLQHFEGDHFKVWEAFASSDPFTRPPRVEKFTVL